MKKVVLGVSASIAAYKAASIITELKKRDVDVHVIMTQHSTAFITPLTLQILSGNPVHVDVMTEPSVERINHIYLAQNTDLLLVAPATANTLGKIANGIADDMLSTVCMATPQTMPRLIAPAMNTKMYENPATQKNLATLKEYGYEEITPVTERLACGDVGIGAMAKVEDIIDIVMAKLNESPLV
ncbi:flavoprotein [Vagococcus intermedius]|uniref:Phosphopantothenoylcysteine decarboxylase n=1 Tax=Vagococcus intermedius TaxID=2991418 RepID=A0AAF0I7E1_9ENTE|nr:flavoprotein [Vagococcus intermedius]WEG73290.1 phosphopantothenoylcysteine decarboxylase [Vagococcus intermedius]WEG75371.1 phosphopantothenoylcysteine decarboxylase [Vagococcus intermedius]